MERQNISRKKQKQNLPQAKASFCRLMNVAQTSFLYLPYQLPLSHKQMPFVSADSKIEYLLTKLSRTPQRKSLRALADLRLSIYLLQTI